MHQARAQLPVPGHQHRRQRDGQAASLGPAVEGVRDQRGQGRRDRRRARAARPELVSAGATAGLSFLDEGPRIKAESERLRKLGVKVQVVVIHQGTANGLNPIGNAPGVPWDGPILAIADQLQDTTVDAMLVGHTHRISNLQYGKFPILEGYNAGMSYSVLQMMVKGGDVDLGRRRDARRQEPGRRRAGRRQGDRRRCQRPDGGAPQPGHRDPAARHQAGADPPVRVGDGQHGHRRDAGPLSRRRGGLHELRRPAPGPAVLAAHGG